MVDTNFYGWGWVSKPLTLQPLASYSSPVNQRVYLVMAPVSVTLLMVSEFKSAVSRLFFAYNWKFIMRDENSCVTREWTLQQWKLLRCHVHALYTMSYGFKLVQSCAIYRFYPIASSVFHHILLHEKMRNWILFLRALSISYESIYWLMYFYIFM